ncbi:hypothetical protein [Saccharothrix variisporea]|uniref:Uncharacterized protein n=1 Tax=Saccharothrix variisporea TaxID=543527 RepID=A0A495X0D1_9PSEU|nr:hypothetical protein [Saccharothrix variisporea]RKT67119.1 hypothetical protein DFJ66_0287 [Saccharothrix variisporea]
MPEDVPPSFLAAQLEELKTAVVRLTDKIDEKFGNHADRIARLEVQNETQAKEIDALKASRRFAATTAVSIVAVLVALSSLVTTIVLKGG